MFQINRVPLGISDLIGAKSWPTNPASMGDVMGLTFDARQEFLLARSEVLQFSTTSAGNGPVAAILCPSDRLYYIHSVACQFTNIIAAGAVKFGVAIGYQPGGSLLLWAASDAQTGSPGERPVVGLAYNNYLPPNTQGLNTGVYFQLMSSTGLGHSYTVTAHVTQILL